MGLMICCISLSGATMARSNWKPLRFEQYAPYCLLSKPYCQQGVVKALDSRGMLDGPLLRYHFTHLVLSLASDRHG